MGGIEEPATPTHTEFSNSIRLTGREWLVVAALTVPFLALAPTLWQRFEPMSPEPDYRMPHALGEDYWLYQRGAQLAAERCDAVVLGDSVVWGEYVTRHETLAHYLNELAGGERYANLGLDGAHPLALGGLVRHYAGVLRGKDVVLQWNPLWLTSARADLQDERLTGFNHPRLVPQFGPYTPAYPAEVAPWMHAAEKLSTRLGAAVEQRLPFNAWANHLRQSYYDQKDMPGWTLDHPYDNPLEPLTHGLPLADDTRRHPPRPWYESGVGKQDYPWVDPDTSLQWPAFQQVVAALRGRGNRVFVLVGPFNEHLLTPGSLERYRHVRATVVAWLEAQQIPHAAPPALPSAQYGDSSHPLAAGYKALARGLWEQRRPR